MMIVTSCTTPSATPSYTLKPRGKMHRPGLSEFRNFYEPTAMELTICLTTLTILPHTSKEATEFS